MFSASTGRSSALVLAAAGVGACGVAACLWFEQQRRQQQDVCDSDIGGVDLSAMRDEEMVEILEEIAEAQRAMRQRTRALASEIDQASFEQVYDKLLSMQSTEKEPLAKRGLKPEDLDVLLSRFATDQRVRQAMAKITACNSLEGNAMEQSPTAEKVVDVYSFILRELQSIRSEMNSLASEAKKYDSELVNTTVEALVSAKVENKFGFSPEALTEHTRILRTNLEGNGKFQKVNGEIQEVMAKIAEGVKA